MAKFSVPMTVLVSVEVDAESVGAAIQSAKDFMDGLEPDPAYIGGWNEVRTAQGLPTVGNVSGFDIEFINSDEVEEI